MPDSLVATASSFAPIYPFAKQQMHQSQQQHSRSMAALLPSITSHSLKRPLSPPLTDDDDGRQRAASTTGAVACDSHSESDQDQDDALTQLQHASGSTEPPMRTHKQTDTPSETKTQTKKRRRNNVTATIEIRELRAHVHELNATLATLTRKWQCEIQDPALWSAACEAARQKWQTALVEAHHSALLEQLTAQQLHMATLQSLLPQSPLCAAAPSSREVFHALHTPLHLRVATNNDAAAAVDRLAQLTARDDAALRLAPALINRFTARHLSDSSTAVPFSRTSIAADATFTYVSTIFVARIPRVSVARVQAAVLSYCDRERDELARRYDVKHEVVPIYSTMEAASLTPMSVLREYAQVQYTSPTTFTSVSCSSFAARMGQCNVASLDDKSVDSHASDSIDDTTDAGNTDGVIVVDFVDRDDALPASSDATRVRRETSLMISVTTDEVVSANTTGSARESPPHVLLRQVRVDRFSLPPDEPLLRAEVRAAEQWHNGDLFMALVCDHLMANQ